MNEARNVPRPDPAKKSSGCGTASALSLVFFLIGVSGFLYFKFFAIMLEGADVFGLVIKTAIIALVVIFGLYFLVKMSER